ncbi:unnamed protein product [Arabidopsis thaliana]|uniref:Uncharacterized protein n=1 Tax=Arabidopsis thaliana TaxID=3702 RepID=Q9FH41_ARATH|nr:unnamed protein product [Arabidopsis thaliana]
MQRFCTKLRSISLQSNRNLSFYGASPHRLIHHSPSPSRHLTTTTLGFANSTKWSFVPAAGVFPSNVSSMGTTFVPHHFVQVRNITSKEKMAKWKKKWRPRTPITSKVKKVKIKFYSSFKDRFKPLNDGTIRRWKEGKRHNAHLKSKKSKRRLRQPGLVPPAYAKDKTIAVERSGLGSTCVFLVGLNFNKRKRQKSNKAVHVSYVEIPLNPHRRTCEFQIIVFSLSDGEYSTLAVYVTCSPHALCFRHINSFLKPLNYYCYCF